MSTLDDIRKLLSLMRCEFELAGDRDICFAPYIACSNDNLEILYSKIVNRYAGQQVKLTQMINELALLI